MRHSFELVAHLVKCNSKPEFFRADRHHGPVDVRIRALAGFIIPVTFERELVDHALISLPYSAASLRRLQHPLLVNTCPNLAYRNVTFIVIAIKPRIVSKCDELLVGLPVRGERLPISVAGVDNTLVDGWDGHLLLLRLGLEWGVLLVDEFGACFCVVVVNANLSLVEPLLHLVYHVFHFLYLVSSLTAHRGQRALDH